MSNSHAAQSAWSSIKNNIDTLNASAIRLLELADSHAARKLAHLHQVRRIWLFFYFVFPLPPAISDRNNPAELSARLTESAHSLKYLVQRTSLSPWWMAWMKPSVRFALWYITMHEAHHLADYERKLLHSSLKPERL